MNISFLTSGHEPFDDRIFYHMARSLADHNNNVLIISSKTDLINVVDGINLNCFAGDHLSKRQKVCQFIERLSVFKPHVIICSEPLPLLASRRFSKNSQEKSRIIYDITEWYPLKAHLKPFSSVYRAFHFIKLVTFNYWVSGFADSFIFGELYKSKFYKILFPQKPFIYLPYFPDLKYISFTKPDLDEKKLRLLYSGEISIARGYKNFSDALKILVNKRTNLVIEVTIIGWYANDQDKADCEYILRSDDNNIFLNILEKQSYKDYLNLIKDTDIFIDLRSDNLVNKYSLPIKLFYYLAHGRPVIFSDLKAIRKVVDFDAFGYLVKPSDTVRISEIIETYLDNKELYYSHCENARDASQGQFNWKINEPQFIEFISPPGLTE